MRQIALKINPTRGNIEELVRLFVTNPTRVKPLE